MREGSSKNVILGTIVLLVIIISIVGFSYAFFRYARLSTTSTSLTGGENGDFKMGFIEESNGISLENPIPISDENAINTEDENAYFDFYVSYDFPKETSLNYEIDLEDVTSQLKDVQSGAITSILTSRIKVALENRSEALPENPMLVNPTYFSILEETPASNNHTGYKLYDKTVQGAGTDYYRFYMWIGEKDDQGVTVPMTDQDGVPGILNQAFSVKVAVQGVGSRDKKTD